MFFMPYAPSQWTMKSLRRAHSRYLDGHHTSSAQVCPTRHALHGLRVMAGGRDRGVGGRAVPMSGVLVFFRAAGPCALGAVPVPGVDDNRWAGDHRLPRRLGDCQRHSDQHPACERGPSAPSIDAAPAPAPSYPPSRCHAVCRHGRLLPRVCDVWRAVAVRLMDPSIGPVVACAPVATRGRRGVPVWGGDSPDTPGRAPHAGGTLGEE